MSKRFNLPIKGFDQTEKQDLSGYLSLAGGVMTGDLEIPESGFIMKSSTGITRWRMTINDTGNLISTNIATQAGQPMGLLLAITYPS